MRALATYGSRILSGVLLAGIGVAYTVQLRALVLHRVDYPIMDDWRYYFAVDGMPADLSAGWLLRPARDTVHASGKLLDWLYLHGVAHDYGSLAAASFGVFVGAWVLCAVALCWRAGQGRPLLRAAALAAFALPLAANPYWVAASPEQWLEPVVAYHQMLPVVGLFALGWLAAVSPRRLPPPVRVAVASVATCFFALAYVSGAVALGVFGAVLVALTRFGRGDAGAPDPLPGIGAAVLAAALLCLAAHVSLPWQAYGANPVVVMRDHQNTFPWQAHWWHSFLGMFDRAVLATTVGRLSLVRGAAVALAVVAPLVPLSLLVWRRRIDGRDRSAAIAIVAIVLAVLVYAALVAYGRADFGGYYFPRTLPLNERAAHYTHARFFYWWVAAVLPLAVLAWGLVVERLASRRWAAAVGAALVVLWLWPKQQDPGFGGRYLTHWDYPALYARDAVEVRDLIRSDRARGRKVKIMPLRFRQLTRVPPAERNPGYMPFFQPPPTLYARADAAGARFVRRWNLDRIAPSEAP